MRASMWIANLLGAAALGTATMISSASCSGLSSEGGACVEDGDCDEGQSCIASTCSESPGDTGAVATLGDGGETSGCEAGTLGCPCMVGVCDAGFVCLDEICATPPNVTSQGGDDDTGGSATANPETGAEVCATHDECGDAEICALDGSCVPAETGAYLMTVMSWAPATCVDGDVFEGSFDLQWSLELGERPIYTSSWVQGGCRGSWADETICLDAGSFMWPFYLQLIDQDFSKHDLIDVLWFDVDGDLSPDPLYPSLLSGGEYNDATASGGVLRITFELVEGCD